MCNPVLSIQVVVKELRLGMSILLPAGKQYIDRRSSGGFKAASLKIVLRRFGYWLSVISYQLSVIRVVAFGLAN